MEILARINREDGTTVVVSLHQVDVALKYCPRTVALHRGKVVYDGASSALTPTLLRELYGVEADEILLPNNPAGPDVAPEPVFLHRAYVEPPIKQHRQEVEAAARAAV